MKISLQLMLVVLFVTNLFLAGMGTMASMIQSSEEIERQAGVPADWRYRNAFEPPAEAGRPEATAIAAK